MNTLLHELILGAVAILGKAIQDNDFSLVQQTVEDGNLALAYVLAKELEIHGYEAFCELIKEYQEGVTL